MQQATSGVGWGCIQSNQTQKEQSLIDERLLFGCLLQKTKNMNATSNLRYLRCKLRLLCIQIKSNTHKNITHWWEIAFWLFVGEKQKKNATSNLRCGPRLLCIWIKSNQTQKTITHWWEIAFWLFVGKNKKMNGTSHLWCGPRLLCIQIKSNQTQKSNLSSMRDFFFVCWWKTKNERN